MRSILDVIVNRKLLLAPITPFLRFATLPRNALSISKWPIELAHLQPAGRERKLASLSRFRSRGVSGSVGHGNLGHFFHSRVKGGHAVPAFRPGLVDGPIGRRQQPLRRG